MRYWIACALICLLAACGDDADTPEVSSPSLEISSSAHTLTLMPPAEWAFSVSDPEVDTYALLSTRETSSDIQIAFRQIDFLEESLQTELDRKSTNPAADYLARYAAWQSQNMLAVYTEPVEVSAGAFPAAVMMYVETFEDNPHNSAHPAVLAVSAVVALSEEEMLVILMEGSATAGQALLPLWAEALQSLRLDGETLAFTADFDAILQDLENPERLFALYQAQSVGNAPTPRADEPAREANPLPGEAHSVARFGDSLRFSRYPNWEITVSIENELRLVSRDEAAQMTIRLLPLPSDYPRNNPLAYLNTLMAETDFEVVEGGIQFPWGVLPTAWVNLINPNPPFTASNVLLLQLSNSLALLQLEIDPEKATPQDWQDWINVLLVLQYNGETISPDDLASVIPEAPQLIVEASE